MQNVELQSSLQGQLLIAQPIANSTFFAQSVVLLCEHHANGAWGLVVNKPSIEVNVGNIAATFGIDYPSEESVYIGGPIETDGLHFIHTPDCLASNTRWVTNTVCVTSSEYILRELAQGRGPKAWRLVVGVSSWKGGQLEGEQSGERPWTPQHRWLTQPCPNNLLELPVRHLWKGQTHNAIESSVNKLF
jgi:putative transcriptional regulator